MTELSKATLIQSAVLLHPSFVTLDDIKGKDSVSGVNLNIRELSL